MTENVNTRIPPTAVGGSFKSSLRSRRPKTHLPNPTHGSGWIVQSQPTKSTPRDSSPESHPRQWVDRSSPAYEVDAPRLISRIPPTAVGGSFNPSLRSRRPETHLPNPTHGSGWIVQSQPTTQNLFRESTRRILRQCTVSHYYRCFRARRRRKLFPPRDRMDALSKI